MSKGDSHLFSGTKGSLQWTVKDNNSKSIKENEKAVAESKIESDFYAGTNGKILESKYKNWIGVNRSENLLNKAHNHLLKNAISQLYRPGSFIGDGGTASVIKFEKRTGIGLGRNGGTHERKGKEMIKYIENKILTQNLSNSDRKLATQLVKKLKQALGENKNEL